MSIDGVLCDVVVERVALGEPLGDVADHAASCPKCRSLVALPTELGAATHREADPGMGFAARMTAGAQHRVVVRRRRRIAAGLAAAVAAMSLGVFFVTHEPQQNKISAIKPPTVPPAAGEHQPDPWNPGEVDEDVAALVNLADTSPRPHAHWKRMENQLAGYRKLVEGAE